MHLFKLPQQTIFRKSHAIIKEDSVEHKLGNDHLIFVHLIIYYEENYIIHCKKYIYNTLCCYDWIWTYIIMQFLNWNICCWCYGSCLL